VVEQGTRFSKGRPEQVLGALVLPLVEPLQFFDAAADVRSLPASPWANVLDGKRPGTRIMVLIAGNATASNK